MLVIGKNSVEEKVKRERREAVAIRREQDILTGLTKSDKPQRGDFNETRQYDKVMSDYRRFKSPKDREKIKSEYYGMQRENRKC